MLTEGQANDVIVLYVVLTSGSTASSSVTDSCGKTWAKRLGSTWSGGTFGIEEWYTTSTAVYNCTITVSYATSSTWRLLGFGVNGANLTTPFDPGVSAPATAAGSGGTTLAPTTGLTTTNANDMLISVFRAAGNAGTITNPTGFSPLATAGTAEQAAYQVVSATQANVKPQWSFTTGSQNTVALYDAIQQAPAAAASIDTSIFQGIP